MIDFFKIDIDSNPDPGKLGSKDFIGNIDLEQFNRLSKKGIIEDRFDPFNDFRLSSSYIDQKIKSIENSTDIDITQYLDILKKGKGFNIYVIGD